MFCSCRRLRWQERYLSMEPRTPKAFGPSTSASYIWNSLVWRNCQFHFEKFQRKARAISDPLHAPAPRNTKVRRRKIDSRNFGRRAEAQLCRSIPTHARDRLVCRGRDKRAPVEFRAVGIVLDSAVKKSFPSAKDSRCALIRSATRGCEALFIARVDRQ